MDEDECYSNTRQDITEIKLETDLPVPEDIVLKTLLWGTASTWVVAVIAFLLHTFYLKTSNSLYGYLHRQHICTGLVHLTLITFYYIMMEHYIISLILYELITLSNLLIPIWTACASWEIFLKLFLFVNGDNVYTKKDMTKFAIISVLVVQMYEEILIFLLYLIQSFDDSCDQVVVPSIRVTSISLVIGLTLEICIVIIIYSIKSSLNRKLSFSYLLHIFLLLISDFILIAFKVDIWKQYIYIAYGFQSSVTAVLLCVRLIGEMAWYVAIPYIKLPIYGNSDIYFT